MALNLRKKVYSFLLSNKDQKFTSRDIAEWVFINYPEECQEKMANSKASKFPLETDADLVQQLIAEIGSQRPDLQRKHPNLKTTEGRPRKYYVTDKSDEIELEEFEEGIIPELGSPHLKEHDLYPILSRYLLSEHGLYSKRIDEKKSKNNKGAGGNKWLFPDLVAMEDLTKDWQQETKDCIKESGVQKTKLWSFEVKKLINRSNIRETFYQTVSNSSWANLGYLVCQIIEGTETIKELRILCGLHGIGFITLDSDNPIESQILIPAKERIEIDWNTVDRLLEENKDFHEYIKLVRQFYQTGDPRENDWD